MDVTQLLVDGFSRVQEAVHRVLDGLAPEDLTARPAESANPIAWLVWHLTRVQDDHLSDAFDVGQVWVEQGWAERAALPFDAAATGYGQSDEQVGAVRLPADLLLGYHDAVHQRTTELLAGVTPGQLDRIVDERWDPPVSLGVRLVSVLADDLQHAGQAAYVRGLLRHRPVG
jgi:hypothetical protein